MKPGLVVATAFFAACAAPDPSTGIGAAKGPDLGNFVAHDDLSSTPDLHLAVQDLSALPDHGVGDLATSHDLATPPDLATSSGCGTVSYAGTCSSNTLTYCYQNQVQTLACTSGKQCTTVSGDSDCRYVNGSACGSVTEGGVCDGTTLAYCNTASGKLVVTDCAAAGQSCSAVFTGFYDCE